MTTSLVLALALVFFAAAGLSFSLINYFAPRPLAARLRRVSDDADSAPPEASSLWQAKILEVLSPAGKLSLPDGGWEASPMRQRFMHAGFRGDQAPLIFFGAKTVLAFTLPLIYILAEGVGAAPATFNMVLIAIVGLAAVGYYLPNLYLNHRIAIRQREIFENLPDAIDLMTVMVEAGLGLDATIARAGEEMQIKSPVLSEELRLVGLELRAGASRDEALRNFALRSGVEEVDLLVSMFVQTDRFGTSMADSLRVHSDSLRTKRRLRAEEAAAKIPLKQLFPLIFCIFPAIMIVLMGPAVISIYRIFFPIATGG